MSNEVFANGNEIACKSGDGKVIAAFPDVCLSPPSPPAGPVPVPYPNTSFSKDMKNGSKTVKIDRKEVMHKDKSFYKTSPLGDEAATRSFGAGVVSHVITGKTYFVAWSMDVKFEGYNVDRHLDLTTSNHASPNANEAAPIPEAEGMSKGEDECPHENIKRDPSKSEHEVNQQDRIETRKHRLDREEQKIDRLVEQAAAAEAAGNISRAAMLLDNALEVDKSIIGERFENKVAEETNAKEISVKITCKDCGIVLGEFDVVTEDGIVKECKASWSQVNEGQFLKEQALAQHSKVFGPGTVVHISIPKGQRGRLNKKFLNKANVTGKIQEH